MPTFTETSFALSSLSITPQTDFAKSVDLLPQQVAAMSPQRKKRKIRPLNPSPACLGTVEEKKDDAPVKSNFFRTTVLKKFRNGDAPIAYKENFVDGKASSTDIVHKIMAKREAKYSLTLKSAVPEEDSLLPGKQYSGLSLERVAESRWMIKDHSNNYYHTPEVGQRYIFVVMPSGRIRVSVRGVDGHLSLSEMTRYIRYAGEVVFDAQQRIASWNNRSFAYCPAPFLAHQAGFNDGLARFQAALDRNDSQKQSTPIFTK